ncbi:MAG: NUDIX domain-containing protein [Acidimicrobiia bacterium]|nr:NUDIX domain-containing protein [Acidimicrobiia bacterium]
MPLRSSGLMPFRLADGLEVLIAHPGGPFWARKDEDAWSLVKGVGDPEETDKETARREFTEETGWAVDDDGWHPLGETTLKSGKRIVAWAVEADFDPDSLQPGHFEMEWKGRQMTFPEIDRVEWFEPDEAIRRLNPAQGVFVERLLEMLTTDTKIPKGNDL